MGERADELLAELHQAVLKPFDSLGFSLRPNPPLSFEPMHPRAMSVFFHWPEDVAAASTQDARAAVLAVLKPREGTRKDCVSLARAAFIYSDTAAAVAGSEVLAPWLRQQLAASPAAQELHAHEVAQALWALKGTMDQSDGVEVQRADIGWIKGCVLACVTVFGLTDMATVCGTAAADFDAMIPL